jgi:hypothetical protein
MCFQASTTNLPKQGLHVSNCSPPWELWSLSCVCVACAAQSAAAGGLALHAEELLRAAEGRSSQHHLSAKAKVIYSQYSVAAAPAISLLVTHALHRSNKPIHRKVDEPRAALPLAPLERTSYRIRWSVVQIVCRGRLGACACIVVVVLALYEYVC